MPSRQRPDDRRSSQPASPRTTAPEETLKTEVIQIERKTFSFALRENARGRFLRITEDVAGRRDHIIVPAPGLDQFKQVVDEMAKISAQTPLRTQQP